MWLTVAELAFHQRLARLIGKLGEEGFWPVLAGMLGDVARFDTWVAVMFRPGLSPLALADQAANYDHDRADLFADYRCGLYRLDPFYSFSLGNISPGIYRLDEVVPESFRESEYFRRYFSLNVVEDEVQFMLPVAGRGVLSLSLGSRHRFRSHEIGALQLFAPWLLALMGKQAALDPALRPGPADPAQGRQRRLEESLRRGRPRLTEREVEVALLVLGGHSTKAVANRLGISHETAKAHRRNLYAKLQVCSQAELFLRFIGPAEAA